MGWLRRNFDTCFIVLQVWLDGITILLACLWGLSVFRNLHEFALYRQLVVVIVGVTLVSFWSCGLYRWRKSILNVEEYRSAFQATALSFLGTAPTIYLLREVDANWQRRDYGSNIGQTQEGKKTYAPCIR